jgi:hypothetical protein
MLRLLILVTADFDIINITLDYEENQEKCQGGIAEIF